MATLLAKPITTTCILPPPTLPQPLLVSTKLIASIRMTCTTSTTSLLCQSAALRNSPMTVPTTAAPSGTDDDDQPWSDSSPAPLEEDPTAITQTFLQECNTFYCEFVNSNNYHHYATLPHKTAAIDTAANNKITQPQSNHQSPMTAAMQMTLSQPCPSPKQSITSIQTTLPASTPISSPPASPCDSPTTVHMPATPSATANNPPWLNSSLTLLEEFSKAEFLQQWTNFYSEFVHSHQNFCCNDTTVPATSVDDKETTTQSWYTQQSLMTATSPMISTKPCPPSSETSVMIQMHTTQTKLSSQPVSSHTSTPISMTEITSEAGETQPWFTPSTTPSDETITRINPKLLHEWHKFYKEFSQSNRNYQNDTLASTTSAINNNADNDAVQSLHQQHSPTTTEPTPTPILLVLSTHHQEMMDSTHQHDHPPSTTPSDSKDSTTQSQSTKPMRTSLTTMLPVSLNHHGRDSSPHHNSAHTIHSTPIVNFGLVWLAASIDWLADQQTRYFAMTTQANAHVLAQLQQLVLIMQPFVAILSTKEDASTPPQTPKSLPNTVSVTTTPDPKSYQSTHNNLSNYPAIIDTIPTIAMNLVKFPLSPGVTNTPIPPWPPPNAVNDLPHKPRHSRAPHPNNKTAPYPCHLPLAPIKSCST